MATNIREEIDLALVDRINDSLLIVLVTRDYSAYDEDTGAVEGITALEMPAVIVNTGHEGEFTEIPGGRIRVKYSPEIVGYVNDTDEYFTKLNELITETKKMLFSDRRIIYNASSIALINSVTEVVTDQGRYAPYGAFSMKIDVTFDYDDSTGGELA